MSKMFKLSVTPHIRDNTDVRKIMYTHINHSNPLNEPSSKQCKIIKDAGIHLAYDGLSLKF